MSDTLPRLTAALADRYRIERELGEGGMATVYLAADLKHDRKVAVKVLRPELAAVIGAERFLSEIKTTANLQHPHILPLFDSGAADSFLFYVMPYVQGETVRDRMNREKQLPIADAVRIATEVAAALDYAHRQGVIHRDIKPENILLHDGSALVADFGIALAASKAGGSRMTETGMSLGTPHYMSPEQAMGEREITARSDVYALGAMTYEMLVGDPPFIGGSAQAIVAKVLTEKPTPPSKSRDTVPEAIDDAVLVALAKLPADRFASAAEFATALAGGGTPSLTTKSGRARLARSTAPLPLLLLLAATAAIAAWGWLSNSRGAPEPTIRFALGLLSSANVSYPAANQLAISPNGDVIAFARRNDRGVRQLFLRRLGELESRAIPGTEGGVQPFFSPDGEWVGFLAERQIRKVPLAGGQPTVVTDLPGLFFGASWGPGGQIVVSRGNRLMMVPATGGTLVPLSPDDTTTSRLFYYPRILPDGKTVIVTRWDGSAVTAGLWVAAIGQGEPQDLNLPGSYPLGYLDGHLLFAKKGGVLMAVPFDLGKGRTTGTPVRVLEGVSVIVSGAAEAALSSSGSLVYHAGAPLKQLVEVDLRGETMAAIPDQRVYLYPRYSPDGKRIAVAVESESGFDIWLYDRGSRTLSRLTTEGTLNDRPEWSPDASRILFRSNRDGDLALWTQPADGRGTPQLVVRGQDGKVWEGVFTPDGRFIIYRTGTVGTADIWIRSLAGDSTPRSLVATPFTEWAPTPSPDGRWLAYESDESGEFQVYVIPLQGPGGRRQISVDGGAEPEWSRDGTRIFYRRFDSRFMATITVDPELAVVRRDSLFSGDYASWFGHSSFDVSLDGQRLLLIAPANDSAGAVVVHNWGSELRARLGGASPAQ